MARRKKEESAASPSASFLGPDPVFDEDDAPSEPEPKPEPPPQPRPAPPQPKPVAPVTTSSEPPNKCLILFSQDQLGALVAHLTKFKAQLNFELRQEFDKGHLGQVLRNLGGG